MITKTPYTVNTRVMATNQYKTFPGTITEVGRNYVKVRPDAGTYFSDEANSRDLSIPLTNCPNYGTNNRVIRRL